MVQNENSYTMNLAPLRCAVGMLGLEKWGNEGIAGLHDCGIYVHPCIHAFMQYLPIPQHPITPLFHFSIIPGRNKQDGWLEIPYYQRFMGFPLHKNRRYSK
jgi:hypothetical protein